MGREFRYTKAVTKLAVADHGNIPMEQPEYEPVVNVNASLNKNN